MKELFYFILFYFFTSATALTWHSTHCSMNSVIPREWCLENYETLQPKGNS